MNRILLMLMERFSKPEFEVIATETRFVIKELTFAIRKTEKLVKVQKSLYSNLMHFLSRSFVNSSTLWTRY